jgi:BirA family biotin operon repressor/biotin-[acetyl-CoA-carboxylase] ligase
MKRLHFQHIDSTNAYLTKHYQELEHMTVVTTDHQSHGVGRMSRVWYGDEQSILCSILLKDNLNDIDITLLPLLAAKSLHVVLSKYVSDLKIKWPNDLLVHGLKISGILVKSIIESNHVLAVIIGFGMNINQDAFDDEIKGIATSLYVETHQTCNKENILNEILHQIEHDLVSITTDKQIIIDYCNTYSALVGHEVIFQDNHQTYHGIAQHMNQDGHLVIKVDHQSFVIHSSDMIKVKLHHHDL